LTARSGFTTMRRVSQQFPPPYPQPPYFQPPGYDFSQYVPQYGQGGYPDLLAPARRASVLQGVLGGLTLACGVCVGAVFWTADLNEAIARTGISVERMTGGGSVEDLRRAYTVLGVGCVALGVALLVLALFVRRANAAATITSVVLCVLILMFLGVNIIGAVLLAAGNAAVAVFTIAMLALPIGLFGLNVTWLIAAARNASQVAAAQRQYQAQFYFYQQQQQAYGQTPYTQHPHQQPQQQWPQQQQQQPFASPTRPAAETPPPSLRPEGGADAADDRDRPA
jgi:hypothetical protein